MEGNKASHYRILRKLGEGGMGEVFLAQDAFLKRKVALKFLPASLSQDRVAHKRFLREARSAAGIDHPYICSIHELAETEDGREFIVMEYLQGETLAEKLAEGVLPLDDALAIAIEIGEALEAAHDRGIVHRDLKPANIMITPGGHAKVMDFGLAKPLEIGSSREEEVASVLTRQGSVVGTLPYMSPEQLTGEQVDFRSDIFSFGIVFYEMLTGVHPFRKATNIATAVAIIQAEPVSLSSHTSQLERLINHMLANDSDNRCQCIREVVSELKRIRYQTSVAKRSKPTGPLQRKSVPSIAVLPFRDLSSEKDQEYFCEGVAEEISSALTCVKNLRVVARASVLAFRETNTDIREISERLGAENLLDGSVRKVGERVRITVQLVGAKDGYQHWSERFDRKLDDIFAIQDEISLKIVERLQVELLSDEKASLVKRHTEQLKAYEFYLRGQHFFYQETKESLLRAVEYFDKALEEDPNYQRARSMMAVALCLLGFWGYVPCEEVYPRAKEEAEKAVAMDPQLGEGYWALADVRWFYDWDWNGALEALNRAINLNPNFEPTYNMLCSYHVAVGSLGEAIAAGRRAVELNPLSVMANTYLSMALIRTGKLEEVVRQLKQTVELDPDHPQTYLLLGGAYTLMGRHEEGIAEIERSVSLSGRSIVFLSALGWAYGYAGAKGKAKEVLEEFKQRSHQEYIRPYLYAKVHSGLGDLDSAFACLDKAFAERDTSLCFFKTDETLISLRSDPRFAELLRKMNLANPV